MRAVFVVVAPALFSFAGQPATTLEWSDNAGPRDLDLALCGALSEGRSFAGGYLVTAHINPSAECTLFLSADRRILALLGGWPVATLGERTVIVHDNQVHFAPVHSLRMSLFDASTRKRTPLYPPVPTPPIRQAHIEKMRARYTPDWCRPRNIACDPTVFDESLRGRVTVEPNSAAIAFTVAYGQDDRPGAEVVYVYRGVGGPNVEWREMSRRDFEARFGAMDNAIDPATLEQIFRR